METSVVIGTVHFIINIFKWILYILQVLSLLLGSEMCSVQRVELE